VNINSKVIDGIVTYPRILFVVKYLSIDVKRRTNMKKSTGTKIPPVISSFEKSILSAIEVAALSKINQKEAADDAIIRNTISIAPLTSLRCQARNDPKRDIRVVTRYMRDIIVSVWFIFLNISYPWKANIAINEVRI